MRLRGVWSWLRNHFRRQEDPILKMCGLGSELWEGIDPDEFVRELREGWDEPGTDTGKTSGTR